MKMQIDFLGSDGTRYDCKYNQGKWSCELNPNFQKLFDTLNTSLKKSDIVTPDIPQPVPQPSIPAPPEPDTFVIFVDGNKMNVKENTSFEKGFLFLEDRYVGTLRKNEHLEKRFESRDIFGDDFKSVDETIDKYQNSDILTHSLFKEKLSEKIATLLTNALKKTTDDDKLAELKLLLKYTRFMVKDLAKELGKQIAALSSSIQILVNIMPSDRKEDVIQNPKFVKEDASTYFTFKLGQEDKKFPTKNFSASKEYVFDPKHKESVIQSFDGKKLVEMKDTNDQQVPKTLLFYGPSGSGKTYIARDVIRVLLNDGYKLMSVKALMGEVIVDAEKEIQIRQRVYDFPSILKETKAEKIMSETEIALMKRGCVAQTPNNVVSSRCATFYAFEKEALPTITIMDAPGSENPQQIIDQFFHKINGKYPTVDFIMDQGDVPDEQLKFSTDANKIWTTAVEEIVDDKRKLNRLEMYKEVLGDKYFTETATALTSKEIGETENKLEELGIPAKAEDLRRLRVRYVQRLIRQGRYINLLIGEMARRARQSNEKHKGKKDDLKIEAEFNRADLDQIESCDAQVEALDNTGLRSSKCNYFTLCDGFQDSQKFLYVTNGCADSIEHEHISSNLQNIFPLDEIGLNVSTTMLLSYLVIPTKVQRKTQQRILHENLPLLLNQIVGTVGS